jgi:hypothetical protein
MLELGSKEMLELGSKEMLELGSKGVGAGGQVSGSVPIAISHLNNAISGNDIKSIAFKNSATI